MLRVEYEKNIFNSIVWVDMADLAYMLIMCLMFPEKHNPSCEQMQVILDLNWSADGQMAHLAANGIPYWMSAGNCQAII